MPVRKKTSTTRLPQSLRDELEGNTPNDHPRTRRASRPKVSRKEARKEERANRKQNKAEFFSRYPSKGKRSAEEEEHPESPKRKRPRHDNLIQPTDSRSAVHRKTSPTLPAKKAKGTLEPSAPRTNPKKTRTPLDKLAQKTNAPPNPTFLRTRQEEEEDSYITYLESKLGVTKGSKKKDSEDDGLDDLLDWATSFGKKNQLDEEVKHVAQASDDENEEGDESSEDDEFVDDEESVDSTSGDEWEGINDGSEDPSLSEPSSQRSAENAEISTRYVPPHLRNVLPDSDKNSEVIAKLSKQLKGLLNRMSEQNMSTILDGVEGIYRDNRRNDVTTTLTNLIIAGIASHSSLLDSYVVLYAAFVSCLHKIIGVEFAAYFVQNVVSLYEQHYAALQDVTSPEKTATSEGSTDAETKGKECSNLIVLLSELYNFQVISSVLVFDIIRGLLNNELTEFGVELLLKIVRNSGQQLRQDDPSALKDIIQIVQSKISDKDEALSSRTRFMIETLINLKNNKLKRNATQNQGAEAVERMKKFLSGLSKKKHVLAHDPLRISLEDLHSAGTKGKWWIVGAAWGGDPLIDRQAEAKAAKIAEVADPAGDLGKLARKQGMNTDIRRSIFVVLMSSDDYIDACERLSQLNLTEVQQREIVRVLLHCCGNEKTYNPYYTLVCQHLCRQSHAYKITLQFCLWDFLRGLGETSVGGAELIKNLKGGIDEGFDLQNISKSRMRNVAKAYAWWISKDCVTLAILKPVDFTVLKSQTQEFLREMMVQIFISSQRETPMISSNPKDVPIARNHGAIEEIFIKATRIQNLAMGLVYFLSQTFRDLSGEEEGTEKLIKWGSGLAKDTLRTGVDIVPNL